MVTFGITYTLATTIAFVACVVAFTVIVVVNVVKQ